MSRLIRATFLITVAISLTGCIGCGPKPVVGGAGGTLLANGQPISEMQITAHRLVGDRWQPIGFGDTDADGNFALVQPGAAGPLMLEPGEHRFTLESIGVPAKVPKAYRQAVTTPLRVDWPTPNQRLELNATIQLRTR